jgi:hypothetical protein
MSTKFREAYKRMADLLQEVNPSLSIDMIDCLIIMQGEYRDAVLARDHYEKEFNRLMAAVMRDKLEEGR